MCSSSSKLYSKAISHLAAANRDDLPIVLFARLAIKNHSEKQLFFVQTILNAAFLYQGIVLLYT
jgi:hypothetical protein